MAFEELKQRHAAMWGAGPFERVAGALLPMHEALIAAVDASPGESWLDAGCGTGELTFLAALTGADIQGTDLAPNLIDTARRQAAERGLDIPFAVADCESLPFGDEAFDIVTSSVGAIFAPDHQRVAAELARVLRPGGRLALSAWTADGTIGEFFRLIASYAPPPPAGAGTALQWGNREHVTELLGDTFELSFTDENAQWEAPTAEDLWDDMSTAFGPIVVLLRSLDDEQKATFRSAMTSLFGRLSTAANEMQIARPYLLVQGIRR